MMDSNPLSVVSIVRYMEVLRQMRSWAQRAPGVEGTWLLPGSGPLDSQRCSQLSHFHGRTHSHGETPGHPAGGESKHLHDDEWKEVLRQSPVKEPPQLGLGPGGATCDWQGEARLNLILSEALGSPFPMTYLSMSSNQALEKSALKVVSVFHLPLPAIPLLTVNSGGEDVGFLLPPPPPTLPKLKKQNSTATYTKDFSFLPKSRNMFS